MSDHEFSRIGRQVISVWSALARRVTLPLAIIVNLGAQIHGQSTSTDAPQYLGSLGCIDCHESPNPLRAQDFVQFTEADTWLHLDRHAIAYKALESDLGQDIGRHLNLGDATKAQQCLSCHVGFTPQAVKQDASLTDQFRFGVSCESCHGPSSLWDIPHRKQSWRKLSPSQKKTFGLANLTDPVSRAQQCYSCHIGDSDRNRFVTHDMYAAGHPSLPSIEVETFLDSMPPHWRSISKKGTFRFREEYMTQNGFVNDALPRTKGVMVGGVLALRQSVKLLADEVAIARRSSRSPDLAAFDCGACHHELRASRVRQQRYVSLRRPGRVPMPQWPKTLAEFAVRYLEHDQQSFKSKLEHLESALDSRPFGDPILVESAAGEFILELDRLANDLAEANLDKARVQASLGKSLDTADGAPFQDFHSARQIAWALRVISTELIGTGRSARERVVHQMRAVGVSANVALDLPDRSSVAVDFQKQYSEKAAAYDPTMVEEQLRRLVRELEELF